MPEDHDPEVPPTAWSGVQRGPLCEGEWVRLVDQKGRRHNFSLESGKRFFSNRGHLEHDDLIGREEGFTVTSSACLLYTSPSPRDGLLSRMPSSA